MIGVLNAYHWDGDANSYQVSYRPMFVEFLQKNFPTEKVKVFEVPKGQVPNDTKECDIWFVSGSAKSCYENLQWINELKRFVQKLNADKTKLIGLCFGHQLIAEALGGKVEKSNRGWGIGVRSVKVFKQKNWMTPVSDSISMLYSHQDQVSRLPKEAEHIGRSDFCEHEIYQIGDHILSMQGHPEFTKDYALGRYQDRLEQIGQTTVAAAVDSLALPVTDKIIWSWIKTFAYSA